jgi:asparagine synthase (glutamine-hydrolysing)
MAGSRRSRARGRVCGVVGVSVDPRRSGATSAAALSARGLEVLHHRGPDAAGVSGDSRSAVGMCHLRVRSRKAVPVPFADRDGAYAYNGEVYRANGTVPADGLAEARVATTTTAGELDGMYAFACRRPDGAIEVGRDPLGIKPLHVRSGDGCVAVASEPAALARMLGPCTVRPEAVAQFLLFGRVVDRGGWHPEIQPFPPGARMRLEDGRIADLAAPPPPPETPDPAGLREAVRDAVERVLVADCQVGLAVSGGLDSSIVATELARAGVDDLRTVSVVFPGQARDDGVRELGDLGLPGRSWRGWTHRWAPFGPAELLDGLPRAVAVLGEPTALTSTTMYARLAALASESEVVVLLLGEGADELFGGYRSYLGLGEERSALAHYLPGPALAGWVERLLGPAAREGAAAALAAALPVGEEPAEVVRRFELEHSLGPLLGRADAILMAASIEGRTPFLHGALPALASAQGWGEMIDGGQTKVGLRRAYAAELPRFERERKQPFRAPLDAWAPALGPRLGGALAELGGTLEEAGVSPPGLAALGAGAGADAAAATVAFRLLTLGIWLAQGVPGTARDGHR